MFFGTKTCCFDFVGFEPFGQSPSGRVVQVSMKTDCAKQKHTYVFGRSGICRYLGKINSRATIISTLPIVDTPSNRLIISAAKLKVGNDRFFLI